MVGPEGRALGWLLHTAVGGGLLLLAAGVLMARTRPVARRQRLGEWAVAAALLLAALSLGPAWLPVTWPAPVLASVGDASLAVPEKGLPADFVPAETDLFPEEPDWAGPAG